MDNRLAALSKQGDPLDAIARLVPWEEFRTEIEAAVLTADSDKKSSAGRKPIDALVMFRMLVVQSLYSLSDEQAEYQARDRLSFTLFLALGIEDRIPDGTTLWPFREKLAKAGLIEKLFGQFGRYLEARGYIARGGQMVDATIVPVPRQRNSREDNEAMKAARRPRNGRRNPRKTGKDSSRLLPVERRKFRRSVATLAESPSASVDSALPVLDDGQSEHAAKV